MKTASIILCCAAFPMVAPAATTIDSTHKHAWACNLGWTNWRDPAASGAVVGEYVCSGYVWSANCGWIHLGDGTPANGIAYSNASAFDYGVNVRDAYSAAGTPKAKLRGYAYAANIGWIDFENVGNPEIFLETGRLSGFAWSANCGWINLGDTIWFVQSNTILPGADSDGDGIADAFEFQYSDPESLTVFTITGDYDGDGKSDVEEYIAGTNPVSAQSLFNVSLFAAEGYSFTLTWTSSPARLYRISRSASLLPGSWELLLDHIAPDGYTTSRTITDAAEKHFFRVEAYPPLAP